MFVFERITEIDEAVFNRLFDDSLPAMDAGSYKWDLFPHITTEQQKRDHIRDNFISIPSQPNGILFQVKQDDRVLQYNCGTLKDGHLVWILGLIGKDINGSKSFMYAEDYHDAEALFWTQNNITSWEMQTAGEGTSMHDHVIKIFDKYDKQGPVEKSNTNIDGLFTLEEADLSLGQRYDLNMKLVTPIFHTDPTQTYVEPANTALEEEMAGYAYIQHSSNTETSNT